MHFCCLPCMFNSWTVLSSFILCSQLIVAVFIRFCWCPRLGTGSSTSQISAKIATFPFLSVRKRCTFLSQRMSPLPVDISGLRGFLTLSEQSAVLLLYFQLGHNHLHVCPSGSPFNSPACVAEGTGDLYRFCVCVSVCVCVYTHTHTDTHIYMPSVAGDVAAPHWRYVCSGERAQDLPLPRQ